MKKNENDFNNFGDTVFDKYNRTGYLIKQDNFYFKITDFRKNIKISKYTNIQFNKTFNDIFIYALNVNGHHQIIS